MFYAPRRRGGLVTLVTPLARQPISCYYYACDLSYFDVVLCPSSSQILATNAQISFSRKPRPPQCSLASIARVPKVTPSKNLRSYNASSRINRSPICQQVQTSELQSFTTIHCGLECASRMRRRTAEQLHATDSRLT